MSDAGNNPWAMWMAEKKRAEALEATIRVHEYTIRSVSTQRDEARAKLAATENDPRVRAEHSFALALEAACRIVEEELAELGDECQARIRNLIPR